MKLLAADNRHK